MFFEHMINRSPLFYASSSISERRERYLVSDIEGYTVSRGRYWSDFKKNGQNIQRQGWKVHVSASPEEIHEILLKSVEVAVRFGIHFKVVNTRSQYLISNGKNADRTAAGKLLTMYPSDVLFEPFVHDLEKQLEGFQGPEILTDLPGSVPCVHYRYGAFIKMTNERGQYCIVDSNGSLQEDKRNILTSDQVEDSEIPIISEAKRRLESKMTLATERLELVKQTNAGGIFKCLYNGEKVYLKIGRWKAGLDREEKDGWERIRNEYIFLNKLRDSGLTAAPLKLVDMNMATALFTSDLDAENLQAFKRNNFPIYNRSSDAWKAYLNEVIIIAEKLSSAIKYMHNHNVFHRDIHSRNVLYKNGTLQLIDFEEAVSRSDSVPGTSKAQGYANSDITTAEEADWYAYRQIIQDLTFGNTGINQFSPSGLDARWNNLYPSMQCSDDIKNLVYILERQARVSHLLSKPSLQFLDRHYQYPVKNSFRELCNNIALREDKCRKITGDISLAPCSDKLSTSIFYSEEAAVNFLYSDAEKKRKYLTTKFWNIPVPENIKDKQLVDLERYYEQNEDFFGPLWRSEVLKLLLLISPKEIEDCDMLIVKSWLDKIATEDWVSRFSPPLEFNSNEWNDQRTGLLFGPLGIAWVFAKWLPYLDDLSSLSYVKHALQFELNFYEKSNNALLSVQGNRLLPYLGTGSAGFGIVLSLLKQYRYELDIDDEAHMLLNACNAEFSICSGLLNGMAGLAIGTMGLQNFLDHHVASSHELIERILRLVPYDNDGAVFLDDAGLRYTFDFAEGASGVLWAIGLLSMMNDDAAARE